ncbi:hypothetical protein [Marinifilum flexuosum]|uniref:hypothetical protein n=1 Tax=Marinifilum flexuosum TaxID=1117708 RepID=UPI0024919CD3|nr:hypothetical protein [Marinifilum flexuosum]
MKLKFKNIILLVVALLAVLWLYRFFDGRHNEEENRLWKQTIERNRFEDYFRFALKYKDSKYLNVAFDSLATTLNHDSICLAVYNQAIYVPSFHEYNLSVEFLNPYDNLGKITKRNVFNISILKGDHVLIEGVKLDHVNLKSELKKFLRNPKNENYLSEKRVRIIKELGRREVSRGLIWISGDFNPIGTSQNTSWRKYFEIYWKVHTIIDEMRHESALLEYGQPFEKLSKNEQQSIIKLVGLVCVFEFKCD